MNEVTYHPYADIFPWIEGPAFDQFVEDVRKHGIREPVVFLDGMILDGRNRQKAADRLGIDYPKDNYEGDDPLGFIVSHNLTRRHLTESQRAMVAAKLAKMPQGARTDLQPSANLPEVSQTTAAAMLNVSERSIRTAKSVHELGSPELIAAVEAGKVSVSAAAEVAGLPKERQATVVAAGPQAVREAAKESRELRGKKPILKEMSDDADELKAHIVERDNIIEDLTAEIADRDAKIAALEPMRMEFERGGFAEVIAGKDEMIRVLETRVATESKAKLENLNFAESWKKKAIKAGYSRDAVIDLETGEVSNG